MVQQCSHLKTENISHGATRFSHIDFPKAIPYTSYRKKLSGLLKLYYQWKLVYVYPLGLWKMSEKLSGANC